MGGAACVKIILCGPPVQHRAQRVVNMAELAVQGHLAVADYKAVEKCIDALMKAEEAMKVAEEEMHEALGFGY